MHMKCDARASHLLHAASSDLSVQSSFWSHTQAIGMHSPSVFLHVNSSDVHTFFSTGQRKKRKKNEENSWKMHATNFDIVHWSTTAAAHNQVCAGTLEWSLWNFCLALHIHLSAPYRRKCAIIIIGGKTRHSEIGYEKRIWHMDCRRSPQLFIVEKPKTENIEENKHVRCAHRSRVKVGPENKGPGRPIDWIASAH